MAENYILLERTELNASAASVTFANIPQTGYTDLKIVVSARSDRADTSDNAIISFNGLTTNLSFRYLQGNGASATSSSGSTGYLGSIDASTATASTFGNAEYYIPNYTSSNYKSVSSDAVDETNATTAYATLTAQLWSSTAAITSINLKPQVGSNFVANSTFSLYGIAAVGTTPAIAPKASGGNIIDYDGTYWIHTFTSSGTFTPQTGLTCDYLVVAGGGGGGVYYGGGGGAGGYLAGSGFAVVSNTALSITVGAGGTGSTNTSIKGFNGNNSVFSSITSTGGGGGASRFNRVGSDGGSGGGGSRDDTIAASGAGGSASPSGQGNGGATAGVTYGGGGGGAGAAATIQNGANGTASSISGSSVTYAGGGGGSRGLDAGGTGGTGGGGNGGNDSTAATNGTVNTGGGAGGGSSGQGGGKLGGSGIVIIRYPAA